MATVFERSLRAFGRALAAYANQSKTVDAFSRAKDAVYRVARYEPDPNAAYDVIETVNAMLDLAIELAAEERQAARAAEIKRLRGQIREDDRHGPASWMRYGT